MATDKSAETSADIQIDIQAEIQADIKAVHDRWQLMWSHREQLLKVARRRSMSLEDAEDAVHEAMLRAAERPDLDDERLGAWLTTVTMRLCVDRHRQVNREAEVHGNPTLVAPGPVPVEEAVCDRAEARWLAVRSGELPARQAEALRLKSEDLDVGQVAARMGLSYRTVESLLARARRTLRASLAGTLGFALFLLGRGRAGAGSKAQTVAVTSAAATLAVAGFVLPHTLDASGDGAHTPVPKPAPSSDARAVRADDTGQRVGVSATRKAAAPTSAAPGRGTGAGPTGPSTDGTFLPLSVPTVPEVPTAPEVPSLPAVPSVRLLAPEIPDLPTAPGLPTTSDLPTAPDLPVKSAVPSAPHPVPTPSASSVKLP
ncbi:RNA polymerase sigma factor [Streptomyces triticisoli]|uniref:RNA polymerase sigma factor n=1 Tax=Streptomyces triticisoli TaxID=2182797 RepID=UPI000DD5ED8C|nr:sigma-70 family RNA polymerase sigma factor [Streptomyces triticisoli]